jgi:hypothetical protein
MAAATAQQRHAARARTARPAARPQRRVSGPIVRPRPVPAPAPVTGVFERLRALPDHRVVDRLLRGRAWICLIGVALMGIVAMQVSLLKLNAGISRAVEASSTLERQNSGMEASIARLASGERIRAAADQRGMVTPAAGAVHYVRVRPGPGDARRAVRRMRSPSDAARELMANGGRVPGALMAPTAMSTPGAAAAPTTTATATPTSTTTSAAGTSAGTTTPAPATPGSTNTPAAGATGSPPAAGTPSATGTPAATTAPSGGTAPTAAPVG